MKTILNLLRDDSGASAAEYALILAIVGSALALAAIGLGNTISGSMKRKPPDYCMSRRRLHYTLMGCRRRFGARHLFYPGGPCGS